MLYKFLLYLWNILVNCLENLNLQVHTKESSSRKKKKKMKKERENSSLLVPKNSHGDNINI